MNSLEPEKINQTVPLDVQREVRFAVVMYGGVSLAIYINGVAQELLKMVRATAPKVADDTLPEGKQAMLGTCELSSSEVVYRKLGQYLDRKNKEKLKAKGEPTVDEIRTRFVIDVISGTSAGGINGIFLAKALAQNQQMEGLKKLWVSEGDLAKLLNDSESVRDLSEEGFTVQSPQRSLLNSQRMYRKLLDALKQMEEEDESSQVKAEQDSPLVGELDLFVTTTDIEGIPLPIKLADDVIYERRYRNVFHFRYVAKEPAPSAVEAVNDFKQENDPFLAFAARCTSSFPFAFEAMRLDDVESVTGDSPLDKWDKFFSEYLRLGFYDLDKAARGENPDGTTGGGGNEAAKERLRKAFSSRAFGDGGYLDNKPFSYATSRLMRRPSDYLVERKLVYVEPTPEHPELMPTRREPLDFAENVQAAVLTLPRKETIREDIERLYERNAIVQRISDFVKNVDADIGFLPYIMPRKSGDDFRTADLSNMINFYGIGYGAYHRIRVGEITNLLAEFVARAAGYDPSSDAIVAIRELVAAWRDRYYEPISTGAKVEGTQELKQTENAFLSDFDVHYRLRRLIFLTRRITELSRIDANGRLDTRAEDLIRNCLTTQGPKLIQQQRGPDWVETFRKELIRVKKTDLVPRLQAGRAAEGNLLSEKRDNEKNSLFEFVSELNFKWTDIRGILQLPPAERRAKAVTLLQERTKTLGRFKSIIKDLTTNVTGFTIVDQEDKRIAGTPDNGSKPAPPHNNVRHPAAIAARLCLQFYYSRFAHYDLVTYPVQYTSGSVEANVVEVFRISPEDAKSLIDERAPGDRRQKLAGRALMSFGAFLDEGWRKNDMLWGRLDGAERLITALLPNESDTETRQDLIDEAHIAILGEEIKKQDITSACRLISNALAHSEPSSNQSRKLRTFVEDLLAGKNLSSEVNNALRQCLKEPKDIWAYYKQDFTVDRHLDPEHALRLLSRATAVTGKMLDGLADKYQVDSGKRVAAWITRLGTTFWNMIAVAVPQSLGNLFFRHWLGLLYLFSVVIILAGIVFKSVGTLGWELLGATAGVNLITWLLGDFIAGNGRWLRAFRGILIATVVALIAFGIYFVAQHSTVFLQQNGVALALIVAGIILCPLAVFEWRRWLRSFFLAPTASFSYRRLLWLTGATFLLGVVLRWIGPAGVVEFEFAEKSDTARQFVAGAGSISRLRLQLAADYLFILVYSATFAGYCAAAAKLFWERYAIRLGKLEKVAGTRATQPSKSTETDDATTSDQKPALFNRLLYYLVVIGFALAAMQWVSGLADATENAGLFWFLNEIEKIPQTWQSARNAQMGLTIAFWCAALKFAVIAAGTLYSSIGFATAALLKEDGLPANSRARLAGHRFLLLLLALISFLVFIIAAGALWRFAMPFFQT